MERIVNQQLTINSLQVSIMGNISGEEFIPETGGYFLIKNISDDELTVTVTLAGSAEPITTKLYPGWNPELCKVVYNAPEGSLQYGY